MEPVDRETRQKVFDYLENALDLQVTAEPWGGDRVKLVVKLFLKPPGGAQAQLVCQDTAYVPLT